MSAPYAESAGIFLVSTLFDLYVMAIMLRFLLQTVRADFYNPVSQFLVKLTNPPLKPLRRIIPGVFGIDMAAVVLMLLLTFLQLAIIQTLASMPLAPAGIAVLAIGKLLGTLFSLYFFSILIQAVLSWVNAGYNPVVGLLHAVNEPILRPARRILPAISGVDLSPLVVLIVLKFLEILLLGPINDIGISLMGR